VATRTKRRLGESNVGRTEEGNALQVQQGCISQLSNLVYPAGREYAGGGEGFKSRFEIKCGTLRAGVIPRIQTRAGANVRSNVRMETNGRKRQLKERERERERGKCYLRATRKPRACASYVARICGVWPNIPDSRGYCAHSPFMSRSRPRRKSRDVSPA